MSKRSQCVGLDLSLKETSIAVIDDAGKIVMRRARGSTAKRTLHPAEPTRSLREAETRELVRPRSDQRAIVLGRVKAEPVIAKRRSASTGGR